MGIGLKCFYVKAEWSMCHYVCVFCVYVCVCVCGFKDKGGWGVRVLGGLGLPW